MRRHAFTITFGVLALAAACSNEPRGTGPADPTPKSSELPAFELRDDTKDLLLTWIDERGDGHTVTAIADVPAPQREQVRVVQTTRVDGTGELVYVADLRSKRGDGTYALKSVSRATWDELSASRRKTRLEAMAPSSAPPSSAAPSASAAPVASGKAPAKRLYAIVYGAPWCKPCHDAAAYLKQRGVVVSYRDIEASEVVAKELEAKLAKAKMGGAQIPIIDFGGRLMVGYSPSALDRIIVSQGGALPM
jgi:glutaredoxin